MFRRLRRRLDTASSRGQALAEFALVLPLLILILLFAIDFGRVFFGWVGLHNVSRIGANYAGMYADRADWSNSADPWRQAYLAQIAADAAAINCTLPPDADRLPTFPNGKEIGDEAVVNLTCEFQMLTPFLAPLFGGTTVPLAAESTFPIRAGIFAGPGGGAPPASGGPTCRVIPNMVDMLVADAREAWTEALFTGNFYPAGSSQDAEAVTAQYPNPTAAPGACVDPLTSVTVSSEPLPPPPCPDGEARVPQMVGLTVGTARTTWFAAGFNSGTFTPSSGSNGQHVQAQTVTPSTPAGDCALVTTTVVITIGTPPVADCIVPNFIGSHSGGAQSTWTAADFTTTVSFRTPGQLPYIINEQSLVSDSLVPCNSNIQLGPGS
jgi:hypothetical protein